MLAKTEKDNKILMQLINHHKKLAEAAKNKVNTDVQMLTLCITSLIITN
jgi:ribosomal protein L18E